MEEQEPVYYIARSAPGREESFLDSIQTVLSKKEDHGIYSVFSPESVKGYVFVEGESYQKISDSLRGIKNFKGLIKTEMSFKEFEKYFDKNAEKIVVNERDIVEVIAGPFRGDKGLVTRVVPGKDELIIEPLDSPVPIPITLNIDDVRVIPKEKEGEMN